MYERLSNYIRGLGGTFEKKSFEMPPLPITVRDKDDPSLIQTGELIYRESFLLPKDTHAEIIAKLGADQTRRCHPDACSVCFEHDPDFPDDNYWQTLTELYELMTGNILDDVIFGPVEERGLIQQNATWEGLGISPDATIIEKWHAVEREERRILTAALVICYAGKYSRSVMEGDRLQRETRIINESCRVDLDAFASMIMCESWR